MSNISKMKFKVVGRPLASSINLVPINITENGTYTAPEGYGYSPITVNVEATFTAQMVYNINGVQTPNYSDSNPSQEGDLPDLTIYVDIPIDANIIDVRFFDCYGGYLRKPGYYDEPITAAGMNTSTDYVVEPSSDITKKRVSHTFLGNDNWLLNTYLRSGATKGQLNRYASIVVAYSE